MSAAIYECLGSAQRLAFENELESELICRSCQQSGIRLSK
jgi:hypothetical protein